MVREVITDVLLALAVLTVAASALGVSLMRTPYARLHYVTPAAVVAPVLVALAVFVTEGLNVYTGGAVLALVFVIAASPFLSHATIRAMRVREDGDWRGPGGTERPDRTQSPGRREQRDRRPETEDAPR